MRSYKEFIAKQKTYKGIERSIKYKISKDNKIERVIVNHIFNKTNFSAEHKVIAGKP